MVIYTKPTLNIALKGDTFDNSLEEDSTKDHDWYKEKNIYIHIYI